MTYPEVNYPEAAVAKYKQENPEVHRVAVAKYTQETPEANRAAVAKIHAGKSLSEQSLQSKKKVLVSQENSGYQYQGVYWSRKNPKSYVFQQRIGKSPKVTKFQ